MPNSLESVAAADENNSRTKNAAGRDGREDVGEGKQDCARAGSHTILDADRDEDENTGAPRNYFLDDD